VHDITLVFAI